MKECKSTDEQTCGKSDAGDNHPPIDLELDQQQFNDWLSCARTSDDVRNRIAVAGDTISRGMFGKFYLLVPNGPVIVSAGDCDQNMQGQAANDDEYEQPLVCCSRN